MNGIAPYGDKRMTVKEVAEALGVDHSTISRHLKAIRESNLCNVAKVENGKAAYLTEAEVTEIKLRIERSGRNDLRSTTELPKTPLEKQLLIRQAMALQEEIIGELQLQLQAAAPKVEFFDTVADSKDAITMRDVAAALNMPNWGRNRIFELLRGESILDERNIPYRYFQDKGYFRVVERSWSDSKGEAHVSLTTLVYQKGIDFIRRKIEAGVSA